MSFDGSKGPPNIDGMTSLKVDNLTYRTGIEDLKKVFGKYGDVGDIYIPRDRDRQQSRGFAFVRFWEKRDAEDAMDLLDKSIVDGREIRVQMARYGRPTETYKPRRRGNNNSYRGGRYRSRSRSRSPRRRSRRYSKSRSRSPPRRRYSRDSRSPKRNRSRSFSPCRSRSPARRVSRSRSPSPTNRRSRSRSRSRSPPPRCRSGSPKRSTSRSPRDRTDNNGEYADGSNND